MAKSLQINVTLDSNCDSKLLESIVLLLANHNSNNVTVEHTDQQLSDTESICSSSPPDTSSQEQVKESAADKTYANRDIHPEAYLNESELALLPARRAARQQRNKHLYTPATSRSTTTKSPIAGPHAASQEVYQKKHVSEFWLESGTSNTALQEWLERKRKEHRHHMRQLARQKREVEKVLRQKAAEVRERARKAQDSYRSWVDNKEQNKKNRTLNSTPKQSTFSIEGIRSPTSTKQAPNPRLRKLKKSISYDEWTRTKKQIHQPHQRIKYYPSSSPKKEQPVKNQKSYTEWLAAKNKQKCELKKVDRHTDVLKPFTQPKNMVTSRKSLDCFGNTGLKRHRQKVQT